ncbi:MAG: exodeoxyribonuclease V subunit alpha [Gammaproteobacteria bacterium]|nr:exodeoxyribonuclease V subunit alpha [Gammaproteobacteria bacterium]
MNGPNKLLEVLLTARLIGPLDRHFAGFLLDKAVRPSGALAMAAALVSRATAEGHVCLDLGQAAAQSLDVADAQGPLKTPTWESWRRQLFESGVVGKPGDYQPLILDRKQRLYLHRYWDYEQRLATGLYQRARQRVEAVDLQQLAIGLKALFDGPDERGTDWQQIAAATALLQRLSVISGGPGTGKTTTVTKLLALLRQQPGGERLRIALAAPTGKAASRMQEAVRRAKATLNLPVELAESIPEQASTLHRLLGIRRAQPGFVHHADNPLPLDVLILDEASMVDVALMAKLLDALPEGSRLILLGDKDQLASVEAGSVLGDICRGCTGPSAEFAELLNRLVGGVNLAAVEQAGFCDAIVTLRRSYRFGAQSSIGRLAQAVNQGDAEGALAQLDMDAEEHDHVSLEKAQDVAKYAAVRYRAFFDQIASAASVQSLFQAVDHFRVLCAIRQGPSGALHMNRLITACLQQAGLRVDEEWFIGRPVMITRNDHQQRLYNGDLGILLPRPDRGGETAVAFPGEGQAPRWLAPARLPPHETVFAMTVHKSQGSEFDRVLLHLPDRDMPILTRELLYTAISRARQTFQLGGSLAVFKSAVQRKMIRNSGLADRLHDTDLF